jgi:hypothetical protein
MEKKSAFSFVLVVSAIIIASALYKQFDFQTLKFQKPALAALYIIVLAVSIGIMVRNAVAKNKES